MAKGSRKRVVRYGKDQSGCMWGLINMFDFRHGSPSQKMLADKKRAADQKRGSKRISGAEHPIELNGEEDSSEIYEDADAGEQCETATTGKLKVKELMEKEMFVHNPRGHTSKSEEDPKQAVSDKQVHGRKNHWRANKKSLDLRDISVVSEKPVHRKHKSLSSIDVTGMMAELSSQVYVKHGGLMTHKKTGEGISIPPNEDPSVTEEKLAEATKVLVSHFIDGKAKDSKIQPSGELMDALHVLNSNKDMFIKLLKDPHSQLMKHIEELEDHQASVDENLKVRAGPDLVEEEKCKHHSFFWRKFKGLDRNLSKKNEHPQDANTIVVLKPGPSSSQIPETGSKSQGERTSHFFFTDFTRRLKLAMRREQPRMSNFDKPVGGENLGMASPNRDHFFIEKIPKPSTKKGYRIGGSYEATSSREQQISDIYIEAKKHLAEIVQKSDAESDLSMQVPKSLGRFLSYSDYSFSPMRSPRKDREYSVVAPGNEIIVQKLQENNVNGACSANELHSTSEDIGDDPPVLKAECNPLHLAADEIHPEGNVEIKSPDVAGQEKQVSSDNFSEPGSLSSSRNEPVVETPKDSEENQTMSVKSDAVVVNQLSSPPSSSSVSSRTEDVEDSDATTDRSERPSPISVLEPIFREYDVSPPSFKPFSVAESFQPRKIKFEDQIVSKPCSRAWEQDRDSVFEFVKAVVHASGLETDQLLERALFSDQLLEPSVFNQVDAYSDRLCRDPTVLFDLINEVLTDACGRDFDGIPSLFTPFMQLKSKRKDIADEIWDDVHWHLQFENGNPTLDQVVVNDFMRSWAWMDLRLECESMGLKMVDDIFEELLEEAVTSLVGVSVLQPEPAEVQSNQEM